MRWRAQQIHFKKGVGADEAEDVDPPQDTATPAAAASSSTDVAQMPEERAEAAIEEPNAEEKVKPEAGVSEI